MLKTVGFPSTRTGDQTIVDGNLVIATSGKGIDQRFNAGTATVHLGVGKELWDAQGHGTPDHIDALVTVIGGVLMLGWLLYAAPFFVSIQTGVFR